jgi:iron complex outermembrane receptor protein
MTAAAPDGARRTSWRRRSVLPGFNLTLGYTFNIRGQSARVFGTLQNVFTITGYSGVDPGANVASTEITSSVNGIDNNVYPRSRTFTGGLSLRF